MTDNDPVNLRSLDAQLKAARERNPSPESKSKSGGDRSGMATGLRLSAELLAGVLFGPIAIVHPAMGMEVMTVAFVVVVIGGLGSFWGVVLAAFLVGVVRGITTHFMPAASEASMYILMFLVLMFRPRGLLGERIERFE